MSGDAKVLNGLLERRTLETQFRELAQISSLDLLSERAEGLARHGTAALSVLIAMLDTADPQLRGGLGQVAARLPRADVLPALQKVARSRNSSDQARLSALTILDRFLHEPLDETLLAGLQDPNTVAAQSLTELIQAMDQNPLSVLEYLSQLAEQPPDVARLILNAIPRLPPNPHLITLLRMFVQGEDERLARAALDQLGKTRSADAASALGGLCATLPPERAALAERGLRKLQMSGIIAAIPIDANRWRSLMSPVDGAGAQVIWFVRQPETNADGILISILLQDPAGVVVTVGSAQAPADQLPPVRPIGTLHAVQTRKDLPTLQLLEAPFDAGRRVLREALMSNWDSGKFPPMEYRFLNAPIWEAPWQTAEESPVPTVSAEPGVTAALLDHPVFGSWFWHIPETEAAARRLEQPHMLTERCRQITALAQASFTPEVVASYRRRLGTMARWLTLAADPAAAAAAMAAAAELETAAPAELSFVRRLIGIGLDLAALNRYSRST